MKTGLNPNVNSAKVRNPDLYNPTYQLGPTQGPLLLFFWTPPALFSLRSYVFYSPIQC